jgi:hypothetical protein
MTADSSSQLGAFDSLGSRCALLFRLSPLTARVATWVSGLRVLPEVVKVTVL